MSDEFPVKQAAEVREDFLRSIRAGARRRGLTVDTSAGSDYYIQGQAIGNELEVIGASQQADADAMMPDSATGDGVDRWLAITGCPPRRVAGGSAGPVVLDATQSTLVRPGLTLLDGQSQRHEVVVGGIFAPGASITIRCLATGLSTDRAPGELLRWEAAPAYAAQTAAVGPAGLTGGSEAEDDDTAKTRYLRRFQAPPGNGNTTDVAEAAEASSPLVQFAFVYPAVEGPATQHVATAGYAGATNKSRQIDPTVMSAVVVPATVGALVEHAKTVVTTVQDAPCAVSIDLSLPSSPAASPPGPGGGWLDGTPWPAPPAGESAAVVTDLFAAVTPTQFGVRASAPPIPGATRIAWLSPLTWTVVHATVTALLGTSGSVYFITVDTPLTGLTAGDGVNAWSASFLSPDATNIDAYFAAVVTAFAQMGPGEKTSNPAILTRSFRRPSTALAWPSSVAGNVTRAVEDTGTEVQGASFRYRQFVTPAVPSSVTGAPLLAVPSNVAFYPTGA